MTESFPCLRTARLTLRPLEPTDAVSLYRVYQSKDVLRYFPNPAPPPLDKIERFVAAQQAHWQRHGYGNWGVVPDGESEVIGWAGLQYLPELDETEVGFLLDRPFWGQGYATEAALASLRFGFDRVGLSCIIALVHPEHLASRRVIEKCGLVVLDQLSLWGMELVRYRTQGGAGC